VNEKNGLVPMDESSPAETESSKTPALRPPRQVALQIAKVFDLIADRLQLESPHPSTAKRVRGARTVPREFVVALMALAERHPDWPALAGFDTTQARETLETGESIRLLSARTAVFLASLNYTYEARWAEVVTNALNTFALATAVARSPRHAELAAEVENLRKLLGRKGGGKKKAKKEENEE
jgi:hypothetical protein